MATTSLINMFGLIFLVWNCHSINSNIIEFKNHLYRSKPHVICLSETWLKLVDRLKISGYSIYRKDRFGKAGGVAILVHDNLLSRNHDSFKYH